MITTNLDLNTLSREKPRAIIFFIVPFDTSRVKNSAINIATNNSKLEADKKLVITSLELRISDLCVISLAVTTSATVVNIDNARSTIVQI